MAKTRLAERHRDTLYAHARKLVIHTEPSELLDTLYAQAATVVTRVVEKDSPPADMKVLRKYQLASRDGCIKLVRADTSEVKQFVYRDESEAPYRAQSYRGCGYRGRSPILLEHADDDTVQAYLDEYEKREERVAQRYSDYKSLIRQARYFEDLVEAWPAAASLRQIICGKQSELSVVTPELIEKLRNDPANAAEMVA